jgi:ABC-type transport system substrate-binding protein
MLCGIVLATLVAIPVGSAVAQDPPPTGTISIGFEGDISTLDPAIAYDSTAWPAIMSIFDQLVRYGEGSELVPGLAEAMPTISDDGLTYTFTLREGVPFVRQGEIVRTVTAEDVVFSINRLLRPDVTPSPSPVGAAFFSVIEGAEAVLDGSAEMATGLKALDERTVEITLSRADRAFINALAMTFGSIIPAESGYDSAAFAADPVGSGAYYLDEYVVGERALFRANPHYREAGLPKNEAVEFRLLLSAEQQLLQAQLNDLDITGNDIPSADWAAVSEDPRYADRVVLDPIVATNYLSMDTSGPDSPFQDVRVRQAVNHVIDKDNLVRLLNGRGQVAGCIFPPGMPGHDPACNPYPRDVEKAKALMAEAGNTGFTTQLYTDTQTISLAMAESVKADLAQLGIDVEIIQQDFDVLLGTISTPHAAPLVMIGWFQDFPDPSDFIDPILSCATAVEGGSNQSWYCNPEIDALAAEARQVVDLAEAIPLYQDIEQRIMADAPWVPTTFSMVSSLKSERLEGFDHIHPIYWWDFWNYSVEG